jgi:hypothetical protein
MPTTAIIARRVRLAPQIGRDLFHHAGNGANTTPCHHCGRPFQPHRSTARFCSGSCRKAAQRVRDRESPAGMPATRPGEARNAFLSVTGVPVPNPETVTLRRKPPELDPRIVPDAKYPGMYRIRRPDGSLSDMVNLARARDALAQSRRPFKGQRP